MSDQLLLQMQGIKKSFVGVEVLHGVDLDLRAGEIHAIVGENGAGKSTLMKTLAGVHMPTEGTIRIGGRDVTDDSPKDRDVAMVFQNYALYPHMTAFENIAFGLRSRRTKKAEVERRVREAAKILEIDELLDKRPKALSNGQRQRVAMGRAIVREPEVFLMDEPLSNLDAKLRATMRGELIRIQRTIGVTTGISPPARPGRRGHTVGWD